MALSERLGLLAVADGTGGRVCGLDPSTGMPIECWPVPGRPTDVAFAADPEQLAVAVDGGESAGRLLLWRFKRKKDRLSLKERELVLGGAPVRMAIGPSGGRLGVALASGDLELVDTHDRKVLGSFPLGGSPRDVVWCDPLRPGPALPEWSDQRPATLDVGASSTGGEPR
jgi:hypothetical protein